MNLETHGDESDMLGLRRTLNMGDGVRLKQPGMMQRCREGVIAAYRWLVPSDKEDPQNPAARAIESNRRGLTEKRQRQAAEVRGVREALAARAGQQKRG